MINRDLKLWRNVGVAALMTAATACGEAGGGHAGEAGEGAVEARPPAGASGEGGPGGESGHAGGEAGEAGVASSYAGLSGDALVGLHLQQLKGFLLLAERLNAENRQEEASVLVGQGVLEAYEEKAAEFGGFDASKVRAAADGAGASAQLAPKLREAEMSIDTARARLSLNHADLTARMVDIAAGIYQSVNQPDFADPTEYQHSLGAALAAKDALVAGRDAMRAHNAAAYDEAVAEVDRLIALWPQTTAPEHPTPYRDVLRQASRVRLALSPFLDATG
ncbi:MAG TPA: hypothetical protein VG841_15495 [Caulobacterales bacterium]|nr:hypothetical protein [Caulobacterales bacterium]